ncbi:autotransporter outer membrane beta-barrel domain-containing protein [Rhizorhabdus phycosphaerae]|uniref:autotransporter outer membrane beta-barrel domain-containing protein n=1 Tax=Rhizorhabdus phycosphaerae TaxID=2711156 RepID=UPI0013EB9F79|nr:autotransporter domain-containing protein [Rhizorhabdus phycosphaerae]
MPDRLPRRPVAIHDRRRSAGLGLAALAAGLSAASAQADPLSVSSARTTAVTTASAANDSAGDISVTSAGSIIVEDEGPAVLVNSDNSVTNEGTIGSSASTGATALLVDASGGRSATITNDGTISVTGSEGSDNYGIRIVGDLFTGSLLGSTDGSVTVGGTNSHAVSIEAPLVGDIGLSNLIVTGADSVALGIYAPVTGDITLDGSSYASAANATGVLIAAPLDGTLTVQGTVSAGQSSGTGTDSDGNTVSIYAASGTVVQISADVTGGFVNDRYYESSAGERVGDTAVSSSDTLIAGALVGTNGSTALLVTPVEGSTTDILISAVGENGTDDGYGIVNRSAISGAGTEYGYSVTSVRIAGTDDAAVSVEGGLINQSNGTITASVRAATAIALEVGSAATVPEIVNQGSITATDSTVESDVTSVAQAIVLRAGSTVNRLVNSGAIGAITSSADSGSATAILDEGGTIGSIVNSGTISASGAEAVAIDLSAGTQAVTVSNSGNIIGDIRFGSGDSTYSASSGKLTGAIAFGSGDNLLSLSGTTSFTNSLTIGTGGTLAVTLSDSATLDLGTSAPLLSSLSASGSSQLVIPIATGSLGVNVTGTASFLGDSRISLYITDQPGSAPIQVLTAGGGIATDHLSTLISQDSLPYLYTLSDYGISNGTLSITLHQRTGSEAGFAPGVAALFDQSMVAFGNGTTFRTIANLPDQASVRAAYRQIIPAGYGSMPIRLAQAVTAGASGAVRGRLDTLAAMEPWRESDAIGFTPWIQQSANLLRQRDKLDDPGFESDRYTLSFGADYALTRSLTVGLASTFAWDDVRIDGMTAVSNKPFSVNSKLVDVYAGWHGGPFFAQLSAGYGWTSYDFQREITIGDILATQSSRWSGKILSSDAVVGARFSLGRFSIEPSNSLSYTRLRQGGYTMSGGGDLDLSVRGRTDKALLENVRLAVGYDVPLGEEQAIGFNLRGGYSLQLDRSVSALSAQFLAGGSAFDMTSARLGGSSVQAGAGLSFRTPGFLVSLAGDRREESGYSDTAFTLAARLAF